MAEQTSSNVSPKDLVSRADHAKQYAYCPYSNFHVGAAILTEEGQVFEGCNVENASYPCGICAERTAVGKAVSEGYKTFVAIAVIGDTDDIITPCGMCRQVLREFSKTMNVYCARKDKSFETYTIEQLLFKSFGPENLK